MSRAGRGWPAQGHKVRGGTGTNLSNMSKAPRLRCEDNVSLTLASVEAPHRSEGYDRAEMLRGRRPSNRERLLVITNKVRKGSGKTFMSVGQ